MTAPLLLVHGDDGFGLDAAVREFAAEIDATDRVEINAGSARRTRRRSTARSSRPAR